MRWLVLVTVVACAPAVDGPVEQGRAADSIDAQRLTAQLAVLPGVARAEVVLTRPVRDPLSTAAPPSPTASLVIVVDDKTDTARLSATARALVRAIAPTAEPTIVVEVGATRAELSSVGPFIVEQSSKAPLKAALAAALALIAALAGFIAWTSRRAA